MREEESEDYALAPGDVLRVRAVVGEGFAVDRLVLDGRGRGALPLVGEVSIGGVSLASATERINEALRAYHRFATVHIELIDPLGHRASVLGTVVSPGFHPVAPNTRIADLMALAGGPREQTTDGESLVLADLSAATVVRDRRPLPISVALALQGHPLHNVRARAGDLVYVPSMSGRRVTVLGQVRSPKTVPFRPGLTLLDVVAMAGGSTRDADGGDVRIVRGALSRARVYRVDMQRLFNGGAYNPVLQAGDVVYVSEHWLASATQVLERLTPLLAMAALTAGIVR
jgi:polysaccharide export outer membrane protein